MHDNEWSLNPQTVANDKQVASELEKVLHMQEAAVPSYEPARRSERNPNHHTRLQQFGRGVLRFFTKEEILFFRIIDDEKPATD